MKVYIFSNLPERAERLADALSDSGANVVSREIEDSTERIEQEVAKAIGAGNADSIVLVVKDPIKAAMDLNKMDGVFAAQCSSASDMNSAKRNGANAIVIGRDANYEELASYIAEGAKQKLGIGRFVRSQAQKVQKPAPVQRKVQAAKAAWPKGGEKGDEEEEEEEEEEIDESEDAETVQGGFFKRIKHSLGIVDAEKHQNDDDEEQ